MISAAAGRATPAPCSLRTLLQQLGSRGAYAGLPAGTNLSHEALDLECSIRFQTTFIPVTGVRGTMEFAAETYLACMRAYMRACVHECVRECVRACVQLLMLLSSCYDVLHDDRYNYNTKSDANPRNVVILCTSQGAAVQQDGVA